jgi:hypothetical protein
MSSIRDRRSGPVRLALSALMVVGLALSVSACRVNGSATLVPVSEENVFGNAIDDFLGVILGREAVGGTALLAVSANVNEDTFRANGTFRNRGAGISFTFAARDSELEGALASGVQSFTGTLEAHEEFRCASFGGAYRSNSKANPGSGMVFGAVFQYGGFTTVVVLILGEDEAETPRYYVGEATKGKLTIPGSECGFD